MEFVQGGDHPPAESLYASALTPATIDISRIALRQEAVAANSRAGVAPFLVNQVEGVDLRVHQPGVFGEVNDFYGDTMQELGRGILMPLPCNGGKSTMSAWIAELAGLGQLVEDDPIPLRGMLFVDRTVGRQQLIETYGRLTPHLRLRVFDSRLGLANLEGTDILALTYQGVALMEEELWMALTTLQDIFTLDEVHQALGPVTSSRLLEARERAKPTVLAMSATPEYDEARSACKVLNISRSITPISPREAIDINIANGVRLFAMYSGETVELNSKRQSITEEDLKGLAGSAKRNELIVDIMCDMASLGRPGLVQCIPGKDKEGKGSAHARAIAALAKERELRVEAVGEFQSEEENKRLVEMFKQGELDALTFTDYLTTSFDYPLGHLIAASPTASRVKKEQYAGRGSRLGEFLLTYMIDIVDKYMTKVPKRPWTFFDVYGYEFFEQGATLVNADRLRSKDEADQQSPRKSKDNNFDTFSPSVIHALDAIPPGTVIDDLTVTRQEYATPPEGYVPLSTLPVMQEGIITAPGACYALGSEVGDDGRPLLVHVKTGQHALFVLPEVDQKLRERYTISPTQVTRNEITNFLVAHGWPSPSFSAFATACKTAHAEFEIKKGTVRMEVAQVKKLLLSLIETPLVDPLKEVAITDLAKVFGTGLNSLLFRVIKQDPSFKPYMRKRRKGLLPQAYRVVEAIALEMAPKLLEDTMATYPGLARRVGSLSIGEIVGNLQKELRDEMWKQKLRTHISEVAVLAFLSQFDSEGAEQTEPEPDAPLPFIPLDDSYLLSGYGKGWIKHGNCVTDSTAATFFQSEDPKDVPRAKEVCASCPVKGDCLQFALQDPPEDPDEEIFGGLTTHERAGLNREVVLQWFRRQAQRS